MNLKFEQAKWLFNRLGWDWSDSWLGAKVTPIKAKHTRSQQGKYWACLHEYGLWAGYSKGEVETHLHNAILCNAYGHGQPRMILGVMTAIPKQRSSSADIDEYSELIETLIRVAAEDGYTFRQAA